MRHLQLLDILVVLFYVSIVQAELSKNQKELERAAELAVERAAERAAERAVEKALNSGNSSTVTVTVKESYSNAKKTAEEAAAPGSESTRPYDPQMYDRQYNYRPPDSGQYDVEESTEDEERSIAGEAINSSVEDLGSVDASQLETPVESNESVYSSFESTKDISKTPITAVIKNLDELHHGHQFSEEFSGLDISSNLKGDFGLKSNTKTFSRSYSKPKDDYTSATVDVDDDEDAEIFKSYSEKFVAPGWSTAKKDGWVRHRPLWDDQRSRVSRSYWDILKDNVAKEMKVMNGPIKFSSNEKEQIRRKAADTQLNYEFAMPIKSSLLNNNESIIFNKSLRREMKIPAMVNHNYSIPIPAETYITTGTYITVPQMYMPPEKTQMIDKNEYIDPNFYQQNVASNELNKKEEERLFQEQVPLIENVEVANDHVSLIKRIANPQLKYKTVIRKIT